MKNTILIAGGGLRGYFAALEAAYRSEDADIYLAEPRQIPGHELTATGHCFLANGGTEFLVPTGAEQKRLLSDLLDAGVHVLFGYQLAGLTLNGDSVCGAVLAGDRGFSLLRCDTVLETEGLLFARAYEGKRQVCLHYILPLVSAEPPFFSETELPGFGTIRVHADARPNVVNLEFTETLSLTFDEYRECSRFLPLMQRKAEEVTLFLRKTYPVFANARPDSFMFRELWAEEETLCQQLLPHGCHVLAAQKPYCLPQPMTSSGLERLRRTIGHALDDILTGEKLPIDTALEKTALLYLPGVKPIVLSDCRILPPKDFGRGTLPLCSLALPQNTVLRGDVERTLFSDVFLAGLGTAGEQTAEALLESGVSFFAADRCALPGGTRHVGMVRGYWNGYQGGRNASFDRELDDYSETTYQTKGHFNGAALILGANRRLRACEDHLFPLTAVCGMETENKNGKKTITAALLCGPAGVFAVRAKEFVDATGDGWAALLAGAGSACGDERDGSTQTFSRFGIPNAKFSNFLNNPASGDFDCADLDNPADYERCIELSILKNGDLDFSPFLTVRESHRILGDYVLDMEDIWNETVFPDTVAVTDTPFDTHGRGSCLFSDMGWNNSFVGSLRARIPARCYYVRNFENLLITAKAFSATRDAASVARMNPDLRNAGYAVGLLASQAILEGCDLRHIDIKAIQAKLSAEGCLPDWTWEQKEPTDRETLYAMTEKGDTDALRRLFLSETDKACCAKKAHGKWEETANPAFALLAVWLGDDSLLNVVAKEAERIESEKPMPRIPEEDALCRALGVLVRAEGTTPAQLLPLIEKAEAGGAPIYYHNKAYKDTIYGYNRVDAWKLPNYRVLFLLAAAVECHADTKLIPAMDALLQKPYISGYRTNGAHTYDAPAVCHGLTPFFCALSELRLSAAAARCGSINGCRRLCSFLSEDRSLLRRFAKDELCALTGTDFGWNTDKWYAYFDAQTTFLAVPYRKLPVLR